MIHAIFVGFTALVGAFSNGGDVWQRLLVVLLHPLGAAGVLLPVLVPRLAPTAIVAIAALLTATVIADLRTAQLIDSGRGARGLGAGTGILGGSGHRDCLRTGSAPNCPGERQVALVRGRTSPSKGSLRRACGAP